MPINARRNELAAALLHAWAAGDGPPTGWSAADTALVWPLLASHGIEASVGASLPPSLLDEPQRQAIRASRERTAVLLMELERVLPNVRAAGCDPVVLKGAALALAAYPDPLQRWFVDLDLLVDRSEVEAVCAALEGVGYQPFRSREDWAYYDAHHLHRILIGPGRSVIEVHWALTLPVSAYRHDATGVMQRGRTAVLGQTTCRVASPADQVIHAAYQHIADGFVDLRRAVDHAHLVRSMTSDDWQVVARLAREGGLERPLSYVLHFMKLMADVQTPWVPQPEQPLGPLSERLLGNLDVPRGCFERRSGQLPDYDHFLHLILLPTWQLRLRDLVRLLTGQGAYQGPGHPHGGLARAPRRLRAGLAHLKNLGGVTLRSLGAISD
jgi:hypothetical protein